MARCCFSDFFQFTYLFVDLSIFSPIDDDLSVQGIKHYIPQFFNELNCTCSFFSLSLKKFATSAISKALCELNTINRGKENYFFSFFFSISCSLKDIIMHLTHRKKNCLFKVGILQQVSLAFLFSVVKRKLNNFSNVASALIYFLPT